MVRINSINDTSDNLFLPTTTATVGQISINSAPFLHSYGTANTFIGATVGNFTLSGAFNTFVGNNIASGLTSGGSNSCVGAACGKSLTTGTNNAYYGTNSGEDATQGTGNSCFGAISGQNITTGSNNLMLGFFSGVNYTSSESSNICLMDYGTVGESHVMRLGMTGSGDAQVNKTFVAAITSTSINAAGSVVIANSSGQLGTQTAATNVINVSTAGETTMPLQPAFFAYPSAALSNVTGDGTVYTLILDSETIDQNSDYNTGTGLFTAPVTGFYSFQTAMQFYALGAGNTTVYIQFVATGQTFSPCAINGANGRDGSGYMTLGGAISLKMTAGDTIGVTLAVAGGAKNISIGAGNTYFSGFLVC